MFNKELDHNKTENIYKLIFLVFVSFYFINIIINMSDYYDTVRCVTGSDRYLSCRFYLYMHNIHLPIHEFGHLLFSPFGYFMTILGGSLFQVIFPISFFVYFLIEKQYFSAGIIIIWIGESIIDVSHYVMDASQRLLPLITNDENTHDWWQLLLDMGILDYDKIIGRTLYISGSFLIITALMFCFFIVFKDGKFISIKF